MLQRRAVAVVLGVVVSGAGVASADEQTPHDKAAAAFVDARKMIENGNCDGAVPKLRESLSYESSIGARLSIVDCVEQRDAVTAWKLLKEASVLALLNHDERLTVVEQRAAILQSRLATIVFRLPSIADQPGFELRVDGELIDRYLFRYGWATSAGRHVVEASANGRRFTGNVNAEIGKETPIEAVLQGEDCRTVAPAAVVAPPPAYHDRGATRRAVGLGLGALGIATIANGVVFGILTLDKKKTIESQCGGSVGNCAAPNHSLDGARESADTMAAISTVSFIVGGAALLGGAALYLTAPSANAPRTGLRFSPQASRGGGGAFLEGTW